MDCDDGKGNFRTCVAINEKHLIKHHITSYKTPYFLHNLHVFGAIFAIIVEKIHGINKS